MHEELKAHLAIQILAAHVRQGLNINPHLVGNALDVADMLEAEIEKRHDAAEATARAEADRVDAAHAAAEMAAKNPPVTGAAAATLESK